MALEPAKSEPSVVVKRIMYCLAVTRAIANVKMGQKAHLFYPIRFLESG